MKKFQIFAFFLADWRDCHESFDTYVWKFTDFFHQRQDVLNAEAGFTGLFADVHFQQNILDNALLFGLFLVIEGVTQAGVIDLLADLIASVGGSSKFILYTVIVWGSVLISAVIDNIPYVATMLPVLSGIAAKTGINPCLLYFGLLTGATLGGNITPIGASANITSVGILRKEGYEVSFGQFARIGIPFTFVAVMGGYLLIWFLWS